MAHSKSKKASTGQRRKDNSRRGAPSQDQKPKRRGKSGSGQRKAESRETNRKTGERGRTSARSRSRSPERPRVASDSARGPLATLLGDFDAQAAEQKTRQILAQWLAAPDQVREGRPEAKDLEATEPKQRSESEKSDVKPLSLDPWQQQAVDALEAGETVVVDAPTTAGKTRVVESYFQTHLNQPGFRAVYTCPVKSLSNDKYREFVDFFGEDVVGIATGDYKKNIHAPILVATLETYRNSLLGVEPDLGRTMAVFDEYHYLQDSGRGSAWEEAMILTPKSCQLLLLSASVRNAQAFADWLKALHDRPTRLVRVEKRPVPLVDLVHVRGRWVEVSCLPEACKQPQAKDLAEKHFGGQRRGAAPAEDIAPAIAGLESTLVTPSIVYAGRRRSCEELAFAIAECLPRLPEARSQALKEQLDALDRSLSARHFLPRNLRAIIQEYGVAYHHSGLPSPGRLAIESLVKKGELRFCVGTMGLSLGINFAVRSAVISDFMRPGEHGPTRYGQSEVLQMLGRAGRRGRDRVGFSCWPSLESYLLLGRAERQDITSRLKNDPTTFLGLVGRGHSLGEIEFFYGRSFLRHTRKQVDLSLMSRDRIERKLGTEELPCLSPAHEYVRFADHDQSLCAKCPQRQACHPFLQSKLGGDLVLMHLHLHQIGALDESDGLTPYGEIARFFPQDGGLLIAEQLVGGAITPGNLAEHIELMATLSLAYYKKPTIPSTYRLPFQPKRVRRRLEELYPVELFSELYDPPSMWRFDYELRSFHLGAGFIIQQWLDGVPWHKLQSRVTNEAFGAGDLMGLLFRVATLLQSVIQSGWPSTRDAAIELRSVLLRDPLSLALFPDTQADEEKELAKSQDSPNLDSSGLSVEP